MENTHSKNRSGAKSRLINAGRRRFLRRSVYFFAAGGLAACGRSPSGASLQQSANQSALNQSATQAQASSPPLSLTPACGDYLLTPSQTPGPFYIPNSPQRQSLLTPETVGERLTVTGQVLTTDCIPLANTLVDVWQTNAQGEYDTDGNTLRGHQYTDAEGRYRIETIVPGRYPGRTRHLHVKVQASDLSMLTTQLYLPEEPLNETDFLFQSALLMTVKETAEGKQAQFDFVI